MNNPIISIITVGMNHLVYIRELYRSLYGEATRPAVPFEAVYVDNCSTDGSVEFLRKEYPQVKIIQNTVSKGFGENNNIGAFASVGKYLAIINPDITLQEGCLDTLCDFMEQHPEVGITVPHLFNKDLSHQYSIRGFITPGIFVNRVLSHGKDDASNKAVEGYLCKTIDTERVQPVNWAVGAALMMSREVYSRLAGFDKDYFLYMEDEDICLRSWQMGCPVVYVPEARMVHNHLRASAKIGRKAFMHFKSLLTFFKKHGCKIPDYAKTYEININSSNMRETLFGHKGGVIFRPLFPCMGNSIRAVHNQELNIAA